MSEQPDLPSDPTSRTDPTGPTDPMGPTDPTSPTDTDKDSAMSDPSLTQQLGLETEELPQQTEQADRPEAATADPGGRRGEQPATGHPAPAGWGYSAPAREYKSGPSALTVVAGLACLLIAGLAVAHEVTGVDIAWRVTAPGIVLGFGVVLVLLGVLGMARRRG